MRHKNGLIILPFIVSAAFLLPGTRCEFGVGCGHLAQSRAISLQRHLLRQFQAVLREAPVICSF